MNIILKSVPKRKIRSNQVGDWYYYGQDEIIAMVDEQLSPDSQLAVLIHEAIEAWLCRKHGITDEMVCASDDQYEAEREEGKHKDDDEDGDDPRSPYRQEHMAASHVERAVCAAIGLNWREHGLLEPVKQVGPPQMESHFAPPI